MRAALELDLPVHLDRAASASLQAQLVEALRAGALDGRLAAGARLPSSRGLAAQLGLARSTVVAAYDQLAGEGYLRAGHGSGTYPSPALTAPQPPPSPAALPQAEAIAPGVDLRPGRPDTTRLLDPAWKAAWRAAANAAVPAGEPPAQGVKELRVAICEHLRVARGIAAEPRDVFVTAGTSEALSLSVHALDLAGRTVAVEDPGYPSARRALTRLGCALHPVGIDEDGLRVEDLPTAAGEIAAVLVTPSHHYPLGAVMDVTRRQRLLAYARGHDVVVIEDDYDSEFRYGAPPLPALASIDRDLVVHVGTFSKTITPWLRAGFAVIPPRWRAAFHQTRADLSCPVSGIEQQALAHYMNAGALRRHIARTRRDYHHRRAHLRRLLAARPELTTTTTPAGLHAVIDLPTGTDAAHLLDQLHAHGITLANLDDYAAHSPLHPGVVLGFGDATTSDLTTVITALHDLLLATPRPTTPASTVRPPEPSQHL